MGKRRNFTDQFKAKVALEGLARRQDDPGDRRPPSAPPKPGWAVEEAGRRRPGGRVLAGAIAGDQRG